MTTAIRDRITLDDTIPTMCTKLAEGNPGAIAVLCDILKRGAEIDPDGVDPVLTIIHLDGFRIYGPRIWMLFKDVCGEDLTKTIGMVRACQLGFVSKEILNCGIDHRGEGLDVESLMAEVREFLPDFGKAKEEG